MSNVNSIAIVGSGSAGLITALILKTKFSDCRIDIIHSKIIPIVGVGEGSTEHFKYFMDYVGIDQNDMISKTDSTLKLGIMFDGWTEKPYFHSVQIPFCTRYAQYFGVYGKLIGEGLSSNDLSDKMFWDSMIHHQAGTNVASQFHFNTVKLNSYLTNICKERGINVIEDTLTDVIVNDSGIDSLVGELTNYKYDFYIDSTGFQKLLISKLGANWTSHKEILKMKSAVMFQLPHANENNFDNYTISKAMKYGWMFTIPVWERTGNGYIFDSDYISFEQAKQEVRELFNRDIMFGKEINFDPGFLKTPWVKNCLAVGLSANFIEPLEATSIGSSIQQAFLLINRLPNYTEDVIDSYNKSVVSIMENIRDYVLMHYLTKKTDTQFWIDAANVKLPDKLKNRLELWKTRLPIQEDFYGESNYILFNAVNYILVMHGLGLFHVDSIKNEFEMCSLSIKNHVSQIQNSIKENEMAPHITHKHYISRIRYQK